jgi:hypothetical protein
MALRLGSFYGPNRPSLADVMNCEATFPDGKRAVLRAGTAGAVCFSVRRRYVWLERQIGMALASPPQQLADSAANVC